MSAGERYKNLRKEIPSNVEIVLAAKNRSYKEVLEVINSGAKIIGENYVYEAQNLCSLLGENSKRVDWHMIGHLQSNKIKNALPVFDCIQTIDSFKKAQEINKACSFLNKTVSVFIEINIAKENSKFGVFPDYNLIEELARKISSLNFLSLKGLMTLGPHESNLENVRPYFKLMKSFFNKLKNANIPNTSVDVLSMGMSDSYKVAIEEGSNMIRLGRCIFGERY